MFDKKSTGKTGLKTFEEGESHTGSLSSQPAQQSLQSGERKKGSTTTRVTIKFDVGFGNLLHIRGKGAGLNWERGILLKNTKPDEWVWETDQPFNFCEFKILINDKEFELGDNHPLSQGASIQFTPKFGCC